MDRRRVTRVVWAGMIGFSIMPVAVVRATVVPHVVAVAGPTCTTHVNVADRSSSWAAPLDRIVSIDVADVSLRDALDRIAAAAKVELSYSAELLPSDQRVCVTLDRVPVGAALETMLAKTTLRAIVIGSTQVVLAPTRPVGPSLSVALEGRRASVLDRVVVTGTPDGAPQRGTPFALEVIDGAQLAKQRASTLGEALDLAVPGVWVWSASAGSLTARYGSVRGASSFGASAPKIYLDGIEVANPLLVTQIDPSRIDRIEVIRGPQGAALYGADAISGVVNILTRHDGSASGGTTLLMSSVAGMSNTEYAPRDAFVQEHKLSLRGGSGRRTFGLGMNLGTVGAYVPGASERRLLADADARLVFANAVLTGTGRLSMQKANASTSLVFGDVSPAFAQSLRANMVTRGYGTGTGSDSSGVGMPRMDSTRVLGDSATGQDITQYTIGATATMMPSLRWTHTIIAGIDGYRMQGLSAAGLPMPSSYSNELTDGQGGADRGTVRARAVGRYDLSDRSMLSLTFAAEHAITRELVDLREQLEGERVGGTGFVASAPVWPRALGVSPIESKWGNSAGLSAQANLEFNNQWYLVAGVRGERSVGFTDLPQRAVLPLLGAAYVRDINGVVLKVRSAFGTGIRPATSLTHAATWMGRILNNGQSTLRPESQSGTELGVDVLVARAFALHVTRFDQQASGLIQPVAAVATYTTAMGRTVRGMTYALENVGAINNRGWELQASTSLDRLMLAGSMSLVDSRVNNVAGDYRGDLRAGDRMLDVPARTYGLSATWSASRWSASTMLTRAEDWIGYDRVRIGEVLAATAGDQEINGRQLRNFWLNYSGVTRLRANMSFRVIGEWSMLVGGDNLLNVQRGAPDNATVTAGRTLTLGLRTGF